MSNSSLLAPGSTLEKRYRILRELGRGGFGRTYLAEDINRYNESCVLKEFYPVVHNFINPDKYCMSFDKWYKNNSIER